MLSKKYAVPRSMKNVLTGEERQLAFIREERYELYVEQDTFRVFTAVPEQILELVMGMLLAAGIIQSKEDVLSYRLCEMNRIYVLLRKELGREIKEAGSLYRWMWERYFPRPKGGLAELPYPIDEILQIDNEISRPLDELGAYYAVYYVHENLKYVAWDTDEINAVDKLVGMLLMNNVAMGRLRGDDEKNNILLSNLRPRAEVLHRIRAMGIYTGVFSGIPTNAAHDYGINLISRIEGGYWVV